MCAAESDSAKENLERELRRVNLKQIVKSKIDPMGRSQFERMTKSKLKRMAKSK